MAPTFSRPAEQTEEASRIYLVVDGFLRSIGTPKSSRALESFPPSLSSTPWRRVYMAQGVHSTDYLTMEPWNPSELSARGILWFFTELPRVGEKICRKTVDGTQTWSGRSGREKKNGFPVDIWVTKLVIRGTAYHMLELTLDDPEKKEFKPAVALCKIWRTGAAAAEESFQSMNEGTPASNQVEDGLEEETGMEIDQPRGTVSDCQMEDPLIVYQQAVSFLHGMVPQFEMACYYSNDEARNIASLVQSAASILRMVASNRLEIIDETRGNTYNSNHQLIMQQAASSSHAHNFSTVEEQMIPASQMATIEQCAIIDDDFANDWEFLSLDEAYDV